MNILRALSGAIHGWQAILFGREDWSRHFALSGSGLVTALILYFLLAFLILLAGTGAAALDPVTIAMGLFVLGLYVAALAISLIATGAMLRWRGPVLSILVPGTYAMMLFLIVGVLFLPVALIGIGALLFRLGQVAGGWSSGISAAFAVLTVVLLVAMPMTLYMLASPTFVAP